MKTYTILVCGTSDFSELVFMSMAETFPFDFGETILKAKLTKEVLLNI